ncbi:Plasmid stabilization system protein [Salinivirga cyanobacteriivorans]|uniref:Plasmid stabilization system protein n=1 Tax=Salinivirga cyanobacteriivorans TaxID=1307839 RepID=A0A0S2HVM3_9BACT|nr:type II toxin-antitoxin system RelE/ParE family toxin [Salinivirga cyanobacteriivorans]ALO14054.1 Plasmid stabilization system protein [Salinivirga cyanobacteriivorans]
MALKIKWTEEAEETFDAVIEYLENKWTEKEARNFAQKTNKVIEQIQKNPYQFKASAVENVRKALVTKHNSLFYNVNEEDSIIELYSFWDNRKDPGKLQY